MNCKVNGCRFKQYHTTIGHKCGLCHKYGHGQIECNNPERIHWLSQFNNDKLEKNDYCTFTKCNHKWSHTTKSHHCHKCFKNHHSDDCLIKSYSNLIQHYDFLKDYDHTGFFSDNPDCFICHSIGMGCKLFLRWKNGKIEGLRIDNDDWGQYGPDTDLTPLFNIFTKDLEDKINEFEDSISLMKTYSCPICRSQNNSEKIVPIKGSDETCKICLDKKVELLFLECSHAVVCNDCFKKL